MSFRLRSWYLLLALAAVLVLTGCSSGAVLSSSSWPGISTSDDTIYLAYGRQVYAIDPETGDDLWRFPDAPQNTQTFYAPPAVADDMIIVADYLGDVYALNPENGDDLWQFTSDPKARFIGGAVIGDEMVYIGNAQGTMYALNRVTGNLEWRFQAQRDIWSTPLLADGALYFTSLDRHVYALNPQDGSVLWKYPDANQPAEGEAIGAMVGTPTLANGVLYFGTFDKRLYALDIESQSLLWSQETANWVWSSPVFDEVSGLLIGGDLDGNVFALNVADGSTVWTETTGGKVVGNPAISELDGQRVVYITSGDAKKVYVLDITDGSEAHAPLEIEGIFPQSFLFFSTGTDTRPVAVYASPVLFGDLVLIGPHEGTQPLQAFDRTSLDRVWAFDPSATN